MTHVRWSTAADEKIENNSPYSSELTQDVAAKAAAKGLYVEFPDEYSLQLDFDNDDYQNRLDSLAVILMEMSGGEEPPILVTRSRHGNWHARIRLPFAVTPIERVALQACLGSDPKRELLAIKLLREGDPTPTVFFELPGWDKPGMKMLPAPQQPKALLQ